MKPTETQTSVHRLQLPVLGNVHLRASAQRQLVGFKRPTPERPLIVSASELRDFLRCRVKWWWRHQARLEAKKGAPALEFGTHIHAMLEGWYQHEPKRRSVKRMEKVAAAYLGAVPTSVLGNDDFQLLKAMVVGYAAWAPEQDAKDGLVACETEKWFEFPLVADGSIRIRGKIDNVFEPVTYRKTVAALEFKSAGQFKTNVVEMNLQLSVYLWALRQMYPKHKRYIAHYTQLRKQMPGPRVKADLFQRESVERSDEEIEQWAVDTSRAALDMLDAAIYPTPDDSCAWGCDFQMPCLLRGDPEGLEHVLQENFQVKERR